jgi:hypothetical protein
MSSVGETLEESHSFANKVFVFFYRFLNLHYISEGLLGDWHGLGSIDHKYSELELEVGVLRFFGIGSVEFESAFVRKEGSLVPWPEMRMIKDRTRRRRRGADGLSCDGAVSIVDGGIVGTVGMEPAVLVQGGAIEEIVIVILLLRRMVFVKLLILLKLGHWKTGKFPAGGCCHELRLALI